MKKLWHDIYLVYLPLMVLLQPFFSSAICISSKIHLLQHLSEKHSLTNTVAEGIGQLQSISWKLTTIANASTATQKRTYNTSASHGLKAGDVLKANNVIAKVQTVNSATQIIVSTTFGTLNNATVQRVRGVAFGDASHAEGAYTTASGYSSHAEGDSTTASGYRSHAEGDSTTASGDRSHAEGAYTTASGYSSHAEGDSTTASGDRSHASGSASVASNAIAFAWNGVPPTVTPCTFTVTNGQTVVFSTYGFPTNMNLSGLLGNDEETWDALDNFTISGWFRPDEEEDGKGTFALEDGTWMETYDGDEMYNNDPQPFKFFAIPYTFHFKGGHENDSITWTANLEVYHPYGSHGDGTFNINPVGGLEGVFVGDTNLVDHIRALLVGWGVSIQE